MKQPHTETPQAAFGLTRRERDGLDFIAGYIAEHRVAPSYDEIKAALNLKSKSSVLRIVNALEGRGHIVHLPGKGRSIALTGTPRAALPALPAKVQAELDRYCLENDEAPGAIIADAISLFLDQRAADAGTAP